MPGSYRAALPANYWPESICVRPNRGRRQDGPNDNERDG